MNQDQYHIFAFVDPDTNEYVYFGRTGIDVYKRRADAIAQARFYQASGRKTTPIMDYLLRLDKEDRRPKVKIVEGPMHISMCASALDRLITAHPDVLNDKRKIFCRGRYAGSPDSEKTRKKKRRHLKKINRNARHARSKHMIETVREKMGYAHPDKPVNHPDNAQHYAFIHEERYRKGQVRKFRKKTNYGFAFADWRREVGFPNPEETSRHVDNIAWYMKWRESKDYLEYYDWVTRKVKERKRSSRKS